MGQEAAGIQKVEVHLFDFRGNPVLGTNARLVSTRNEKGQYDYIFPAVAKSDVNGLAVFNVWTKTRTINSDEAEEKVTEDDADPFREITLYVEVDGLWLKQSVAGDAKTIFDK